MVKNALGLIEVVGLAAGMEAADAAVKSANVELLGYELTKGGGLVVIKVVGDVGAVKAAVDAGAAAAAKVNKVYAKHVIPRPHNELGGIVITKDTVGQKPASKTADVKKPTKQAAAPVAAVEAEEVAKLTDTGKEDAGGKPAEAVEAASREPINPADVCNLCGDPACPRKKGDPRVTCIHNDKNKEDE
ncbi:MAG: microcompartment protein [Firmicutes bacterium]|nr:microcompartment protein [Bacillota bacterium]